MRTQNKILLLLTVFLMMVFGNGEVGASASCFALFPSSRHNAEDE